MGCRAPHTRMSGTHASRWRPLLVVSSVWHCAGAQHESCAATRMRPILRPRLPRRPCRACRAAKGRPTWSYCRACWARAAAAGCVGGRGARGCPQQVAFKTAGPPRDVLSWSCFRVLAHIQILYTRLVCDCGCWQVVEGLWRGERVAVKLLERHPWAGLLQAPQAQPKQPQPPGCQGTELQRTAGSVADGAAAAEELVGSGAAAAAAAEGTSVAVSLTRAAAAGGIPANPGPSAAAAPEGPGLASLLAAVGEEAWPAAFRAEVEVRDRNE
jgi:hypothetical protein